MNIVRWRVSANAFSGVPPPASLSTHPHNEATPYSRLSELSSSPLTVTELLVFFGINLSGLVLIVLYKLWKDKNMASDGKWGIVGEIMLAKEL